MLDRIKAILGYIGLWKGRASPDGGSPFDALSSSIGLLGTGGSYSVFSPEELVSRRLNSWKGWFCSAGCENIYINNDGNLYIGECKTGGMRGNIYDNHVDVPSEWIECDQDRCRYVQDMRLRKARRRELISQRLPPSRKPVEGEAKGFDRVVPYSRGDFEKFPMSVTWNLGRHCNYSCHYCHPSISNNYESHKSWGSLKHAADNIEKHFLFGKRARWILTGGEPTVNPKFMDLVKYLHEKGHRLHTQTNAGRRTDYYEELVGYSSIGFSVHLRYFQEEAFLGICRSLMDRVGSGRAKNGFEIHIMVPPDTLDMALNIKDKILGLPGFDNFSHIHLKPLHKIGIKKADGMLEYDGDEYERILAHA